MNEDSQGEIIATAGQRRPYNPVNSSASIENHDLANPQPVKIEVDVTEENSGAKSSKQKRKKRVIRYQINA